MASSDSNSRSSPSPKSSRRRSRSRVSAAARRSAPEIVREHVEGVEPGGHDDVEVDPRRDAGDPGHVAAESERGRVENGVDARRLQGVQPANGVVDPGLLVAPPLGVVLLDLGRDDEHVLVHQHPTEVGLVDGSSDGLDRGHGRTLLVGGPAVPGNRLPGDTHHRNCAAHPPPGWVTGARTGVAVACGASTRLRPPPASRRRG